MANTRKYHIALSGREREQLEQIVVRQSTTRATRAKILLLADEGPSGPALPPGIIAEYLDVSHVTVNLALKNAMQTDPAKAAMGLRQEQLLSPETDLEITQHIALGDFTKSELARQHGIHRNAIPSVIRRALSDPVQHDTRDKLISNRKLTDEQELEVCEEVAKQELSKAEIGRRYGISPSTVNHIVDRHNRER